MIHTLAYPLLTYGGMRKHFIVGLIIVGLTTASSAQSPRASSPSKPDKPMVLVGCVAADEANAEQFTLSDKKAGVTYRLTGTKLHAYTGHRVRIVGGLYPSTNIAAQAGAIDPTKAAIAATTPPETATAQLPEVRVNQVRQLRGPCDPASR